MSPEAIGDDKPDLRRRSHQVVRRPPTLRAVTELVALRGDITTLEVDAIVNAANSELRPGGGVDGAIHAAGGPEIASEARAVALRNGRLETGSAVPTTAGRLRARHVIHTVGPIWGESDREESVGLLGDCYRNSLNLAEDLDCRSIAFPNISTGVYRFPKPLAAETAVTAVRIWVETQRRRLERVVFVSFDDENQALYEELLAQD